MNSAFRNKLLADVEDETGCTLNSGERAIVDAALYVLKYRAERRVRTALVEGMGAEKHYHFDAQYRAAIDTLARVSVDAIFGDMAPSQAELASAYNLIAGDWFEEHVVPASEKETWLAQNMAPSPVTQSLHWKGEEVTKEKLIAALEQMKAPPPYAYGPVIMGSNAGKQKPVPVPSGTKTGRFSVKKQPEPTAPSVEELLEIVQRRSAELAAEKSGPLTEAIKKKYPGVFGHDAGKELADEDTAEFNAQFSDDK